MVVHGVHSMVVPVDQMPVKKGMGLGTYSDLDLVCPKDQQQIRSLGYIIVCCATMVSQANRVRQGVVATNRNSIDLAPQLGCSVPSSRQG